MVGVPEPTVPRPFRPRTRLLCEPDPVHAELRAAGPVARTELPGGTTAWVVTEESLARDVLTDRRFAKDTALAPPGMPDLEPTPAERLSLTTADGPVHTRLRRAHAPLLTHRAVARHADRIAATVRDLLAELGPGEVDLMAGFTTRYPLTVVLDLVGAPPELLDDAADACRAMWSDDPAAAGDAFVRINEIARAAVGRPGLATALRDRLPELDDDAIGYLVFGLVFAGQLTTDTALGSLLARALERGLPGATDAALDALAGEVLREQPPAPYGLWRFTTVEVELAGEHLQVGAPVLVDLQGLGQGRLTGPDLPFGYGPHFCVGAHLARLELVTALQVLRDEYPQARLAAPAAELVEVHPPGPAGGRLAALPVVLREQ